MNNLIIRIKNVLSRTNKKLRPQHLRTQIMVILGIILIVTISASIIYTIYDQSKRTMKEVRYEAVIIAQSIVTSTKSLLIFNDLAAIEKQLLLFSEFPNVNSIQIVKNNGKIMSNVISEKNKKPKVRLSKENLNPPLSANSVFIFKDDQFYVWYPIESGKLLGWVRLEYNLHHVNETKSSIIKEGLFTGIITIAINLFLLWIFLKRPVVAVQNLTTFSKTLINIQGDQIQHKTDIYEIDELIEALNAASHRLCIQGQEIKETSERFETIFNAAVDGIITINKKGIIESFNPAAEKIFGYKNTEVVGQNIKMLMPEPYHSEHDQYLANHIDADERKIIGKGREVKGEKKDGSVFPMDLAISRAYLNGRLIFAGIVRNVTDRHKANQELQEAKQNLEQKVEKRTLELKEINKKLKEDIERRIQTEKMLRSLQGQLVQSEKMASIGHLAAGVAHEINNPIGFIGSNMQTLEEYVKNILQVYHLSKKLQESVDRDNMNESHTLSDKIRTIEKEKNFDFMVNDMNNLLEESKRGLERVKKIVMDLRIFSREDTGTMENIKVEQIIESILGIVNNEIKYKAELKKMYGETPIIRCNTQKLGQVFMNLIINASQSIIDRGEITIKTYQNNGNVCVQVEDTGMGISQEQLIKIFDPFYTTKPVGEGTGLGLSISYDIVSKHGGDILVNSELGKGTTFTVQLPVTPNVS